MFPCRESIVSLKRKYLRSAGEDSVSVSQPSMDGVLDAIADEGCRSLLEEVFLDLEVGRRPPSCLHPGASLRWVCRVWRGRGGRSPCRTAESVSVDGEVDRSVLQGAVMTVSGVWMPERTEGAGSLPPRPVGPSQFKVDADRAVRQMR